MQEMPAPIHTYSDSHLFGFTGILLDPPEGAKPDAITPFPTQQSKIGGFTTHRGNHLWELKQWGGGSQVCCQPLSLLAVGAKKSVHLEDCVGFGFADLLSKMRQKTGSSLGQFASEFSTRPAALPWDYLSQGEIQDARPLLWNLMGEWM